ncbi:MAG: molybdopterin oxidoreductase family protein [Actinomycetota bacterium]
MSPDMPTVRSHCPYCALNCGVELETDGRRIDAMRRWKTAPLTAGAVCSKGSTAHLQVDHRERLTRPLLRRGRDFVEIDWDDALDRTVHGFARIRRDHGADANAVLSGGSFVNEKVYLLGKLARLAFRTPHIDYNGRFCMTAAGAAHSAAFGRDRMMTPLADLDLADTVVVSGANLSTSFPVVIPPALARLRRRGGRVVVVDPRAERFMKPDDLHVALRPGTDSVLWAGVLAALARHGAIDTDFVSSRTAGLEAALTAAATWTPEDVCRIADVERCVFDELVETLAASSNCIYLHGRGSEQQRTGVDNVSALINVALVRGHAGRPGSGVDMLTGQRNGQGGREWGQRCNQLPAGRDIEDDDHRRQVARAWGVPPERLPSSGATYVEILRKAGRGEIRGLLAFGTNIAVSSPDLDAVETQLDTLDHLVVVDPFFSSTARHADLVLPGTTFAEETGTITTIEGRVVLCEQAVEPAPARSDFDIIAAVAAGLGCDDGFTFAGTHDVFTEMTELSSGAPVDYAGITHERLRSGDGVFWPCPTPEHPGTPRLHLDRFAHPDGLARFRVVEPIPPGRDLDRPLTLTNGRVLAQFLSGNQTMRIPDQNERDPDPYVELPPAVVDELGLTANDRVQVSSRTGEVTLTWRMNDRLRPDTLFMPYHWPECNRLVAADLDPVCSIPAFKHTSVRVTAVRFTETSHDRDVVLAGSGEDRTHG